MRKVSQAPKGQKEITVSRGQQEIVVTVDRQENQE